MNDTINNDAVDPMVPFVTDAPGIVTEAGETTVHVAEDTVDVPVEGEAEAAPF